MRLLGRPTLAHALTPSARRPLAAAMGRAGASRAAAAVAALALLAGCGGSPTAPRQDEVFYLHGASGMLSKDTSFEVYFPPLDAPPTDRVPRRIGVGLMNGDVRISRPIDWNVGGADNAPEHRYITYQSPRQFLFSIYERIDSPEDPWPDVLKRYEADLEEQGAQILSGRAPVATANTQGRSYLVKAKIPSKPVSDAFAHEILVRSPHRVLLVQIVHNENVDASADEITAALQSLTVY
ncbi:hypothetical protein SOCE26_061960 [Sorangium cellulosum]|uniref:Uncharacterized protein n=1 Tax=Sorangium cellulosum TaxID=56 RepID=A0A2L0EZR2_SORCE|nr:hypothetical protein [Sorangium cellulosum]AUX44729.1 hypothetical protein SOCE26_061960 [Sorangium cellulosum]